MQRAIKIAVAVIALEVVVIGALLFKAPVESVVSSEVASLEASDRTTSEATSEDETATPVSFTVTFAGDCTIGTDVNYEGSGSFNSRWTAENADATYFLRNVADVFSSDDLTVVNMEGTLTTRGERADKTFAFKGKPEYAKIFSSSSVEAASLANNHSHDYGDVSYTDTIDALDAEGITSFGYDRIGYFDVKGVKVALVGAYALNESVDYVTEMTDNIKAARENGAQVVMVYVHWGVEKEYVPNDTQRKMAYAAIDAGADLVVGSHPHVIQGWEVYQGRYIVYSLGNFCFGGNTNPADKDCIMFQQTFTVTGDDVEKNDDVNFIACSISTSTTSNTYQPTIAEGDEKTRIEKKLQESTDEIAALPALSS